MSVKRDIPDNRGRRWNSYLTWLNILGAERRSERHRRLLIPLFGSSSVGSSCILITYYTCKLPWRRRNVSVIIFVSIFIALVTDEDGRHMKLHNRQQCDYISLY